MAQNFNLFDFVLTDDDMTEIAALDTGKTMFFEHRDPKQVARLNSLRRKT
jgi:2,5-diketo-D-gluconate reductase A